MNREQIENNARVEDEHWWFEARRRIVRRLANAVLPPDRSRRVVDVGCGTGGNAAALARDYQVLGLDASRDAIEFARRRRVGASFELARGLDVLREAVRGADLVLLMDVIEHVEDDFELVSSVACELAAGAHVLVTVPADRELWSPHDVGSLHWRRYERDRLRAVWRGLPLYERLFSGFNARLYPLVRGARALNNWRGRASGAAATDVALPPRPLNALLRGLFAGEAEPLLASLDRGIEPYAAGVSWIALLRRDAGECAPRRKPAGLAPDQHRPASFD